MTLRSHLIKVSLCSVTLCSTLALGEVESVTVLENGLHGGGYQSDVAITPDGLTVMSGGDVAGINVSRDGGQLFHLKNKGLRSIKIATLAITPDNPQIVYAGTGDKGNSGGLFVSVDGGESWSRPAAGDDAQFAGNHSADADPLPDGHPRSNGNLIAIISGNDQESNTDDVIIAGTYEAGIKVFTDGGQHLADTVNDSAFVRSVSAHPNRPHKAYAALYFSNAAENGIYEIDITNPTAVTSTMIYAAAEPEEVIVLENGHVYAALGSAGIAGDTGGGWTLRNAGLTHNETLVWAAVTGYSRGEEDVIYATVNNSQGNTGSNYSSVWRSENSGQSWTPLVNRNENVSVSIYDGTGQGGEDWWFEKGFNNALLGRKQTSFSSVEVAIGESATTADDVIYLSGRGGVWKSPNGGAQWWPAVNNMQVTANRAVAVNPLNPAQVLVGNTDFVIMQSANNLSSNSVKRDKPNGAESRSYDVTFDAVSGEAIAATGSRDSNSGGEILVKPAENLGNPADAGWRSLNLSAVASGKIPQAVVTGYHNGTFATSQIILTVVRDEGVYRYQNNSWTKATGITIGDSVRSRLVWPDSQNSGVVFLLDTSGIAGLYRSNDGGSTWTDMWPGMKFRNNNFYIAGFIAADSPDTLYVSAQGDSSSFIGTGFRVFRLNHSSSAVYGEPNNDPNVDEIDTHSNGTDIRRPGPLVIDPKGRLWLTQRADSQNNVLASLFLMENPATDESFVDMSSLAYEQTAVDPIGIDVSSSDYMYVSQSSGGVVKMRIIGEMGSAQLQDWREENFGTDQNTGSAADDADPDQDGIVNLLEYATRLDPNNSRESEVFQMVESVINPGELEVKFNRVADESLTYSLEATSSLESMSWSVIETFTGVANDAVSVPQSAWLDQTNRQYFMRLKLDRE